MRLSASGCRLQSTCEWTEFFCCMFVNQLAQKRVPFNNRCITVYSTAYAVYMSICILWYCVDLLQAVRYHYVKKKKMGKMSLMWQNLRRSDSGCGRTDCAPRSGGCTPALHLFPHTVTIEEQIGFVWIWDCPWSHFIAPLIIARIDTSCSF